MATFMERLTFLQKVPTLMKATADDEHPCPGYLFQEIGKMSNESLGCGQCLLEYLLGRLQVESCHVKLKVLKIFVHLCGHGSNNFLTELRRNSTFIQQASVYSGPPDPIHGTALYQKVRNTAQEVAKLLFTDSVAIKSISPCTLATPTMGMGSASVHKSGMQGFGYSPGKQGTGSDTLLDKIQKAAEVVASAVLPPIEHQGLRLHENNYRAVAAPSAPIEVAVPACAYNLPTRRHKVTKRCPGQVGGGWEEIDSANSSSHNSTLDNAANSRASVGRSSKSGGTGSQSDASRESSSDLSERVEAMQLGDCGQEMVLISSLTEGSKVFLSRDESQHFIKECSTLNCEVVGELLSHRLQEPSSTVQMRALCAVSCLMTSDLLSLEQIFGLTKSRLVLLTEGPTGPVANKATKILRQFEALMGGPVHTAKQGNTDINSHLSTADSPPTLAYHPTPLLPTQTAAASIFNHYQERDLRSAAGVTQPQTPPPPPVATQPQTPPPPLDLSHKDPSLVLVNDNEEKMYSSLSEEAAESMKGEKMYSSLSEEAAESMKVSVWNGEAQAQRVGNPQHPTEKGLLSPNEPQDDLPCPGKLSLFSGMELVNRGTPLSLCGEREDLQSETTNTEERIGYAREGSMVDCSDNLTNSPLTCDVTSNSNQPASAFSFLNC